MKKFKIVLLIFVALFALIQFFPVERDNPEISYEVKWDSQQTKDFFYRACADCHSNETKWPWYSYVAPVSFIISNHVVDGRRHFNISTGNLDDANEAAEAVEKGFMPLEGYVKLHSEADLTPEEKDAFIKGLMKTFMF